MFVRVAILAAAILLAWAAFARGSEATAPERSYTVRPADTLWAIAASAYGGDPRAGVWKIRRRNRLPGTTLRPGQRLVLPG